jgi:hypothetical protein
MVSPHAAESLSHDSTSTDEDANINGKLHISVNFELDEGSVLAEILNVKDGNYKLYDIDSRVGLNGSHSFSNFHCLHDEATQKFFVWMGDLSIDKFTKTTFLNLVNFAEKTGSQQLILI